jgi:hypothetical protein
VRLRFPNLGELPSALQRGTKAKNGDGIAG